MKIIFVFFVNIKKKYLILLHNEAIKMMITNNL